MNQNHAEATGGAAVTGGLATDESPAENLSQSVTGQGSPSQPSRHWPIFIAEVIAAVLGAALPVALARSIEVNPLDRIGQVSALAGIEFRFAVLGLVLLGTVVVAAKVRRRAVFPTVSNLAFAAVAGLTSGLVGAGVLVALSGTTWPLYANVGDSGRLAQWASSLLSGNGMPATYPPVSIHLIAWWADLTGNGTFSALKFIQIALTSLFGPLAYLSWRLVLRPPWALGIGLVAALPLIDPYKPYTNVVLVILLPVLIKFMQVIRESDRNAWIRIALSGTGFGITTGLLFLTYPGWFVWSAAGTFAALLVIFPWRQGAVRGLALLGVTAAAFAAVAGPYLFTMLSASTSTKDQYFYFDTYVQPAYIAMWRSDLPGDPGPWPPPGELAGVGVFSVLLVIGLGAAIALGRRHTVVITVGFCLLSAWLMRFWLASQMYETGAVQLYPRTTPQILHCLLLLTGFAVYFAWHKLKDRWTTENTPSASMLDSHRAEAAHDAHQSSTAHRHIGLLCALLLFSAFAGSAVADRYMPSNDNSLGFLSYVSQMIRKPDGRCPTYSAPDRCADNFGELLKRKRQEENQA